MKTPLYDRHQKLSAAFKEYGGWLLPFSYGDWLKEYNEAHSSVAVMDTCHWGRVELRGVDSLDLLNRLSTNALDKATSGFAVPTVLTNEKGRVLDHIMTYVQDGYLLLVVSANMAQRVIQWLDKYTFGEDAKSKDLSSSWGMLSLLGPQGGALLQEVFGSALPKSSSRQVHALRFRESRVLVSKSSLVYGQGFDLIAPASLIPDLWDCLFEEGRSLGITPLGQQAYEVLRIEAGVPLLGREIGLEYNPLEAGLAASVSSTKGCYIGQEVIARLNTYHKVKRHLMGVLVSNHLPVTPNTRLEKDGAEVGFITSSAFSPRLNQQVALGYVHKEFAQPGTRVSLFQSERPVPAVLSELPFK